MVKTTDFGFKVAISIVSETSVGLSNFDQKIDILGRSYTLPIIVLCTDSESMKTGKVK